MVPWWEFLLIALFGALAGVFLIGGFIIGMRYSMRGVPSKAYQIFAISFALGIPSAGIVMALYLRESWVFPFSLVVAAFIAFINWLMSRFTKL